MPITKDVDNVIQYSQRKDTWESNITGVFPALDFRVADDSDVTKQLGVDTSGQAKSTTVTLKTNAATAANIVVTLPSTSGTLAYGGGSSDSFSTIQTPLGTSPVATSPTDTLTLTSSNGSVSITGNSGTDTVDFVVASSPSFTGALSGDVTGTQSATVVSTVGGKTASAVATSVNDTVAATSSNTASTIAKRDSNGNISCGVISPLTTKTANYTLGAGDGLVLVNSAGGAFNITLPSPVSGKRYSIKDGCVGRSGGVRRYRAGGLFRWSSGSGWR